MTSIDVAMGFSQRSFLDDLNELKTDRIFTVKMNQIFNCQTIAD